MKKTTIVPFLSNQIFNPLFIFFVFGFYQSIAQNQLNDSFQEIILNEPVCIYHPAPESYTGPNITRLRDRAALSEQPCSNFEVTYIGFTPEAQAAFQYAVDIWSHTIESSVDILITARFEPLTGSTLGFASPASVNTISGVPGIDPTIWYPKALFEKLLGEDSDPFGSSNDINTTFNSDANFYYGLDGNPPFNQVDFVSVVLHELGHGLGFIGFGRVDAFEGAIRNGTRPLVYDTFIENGAGISLLTYDDPSVDLFTQFTSENLFCNSPSAIAQNNGELPKIHAPFAFSQGSSYSHWDEGTYLAGNINSLMTPQIAPGEANHDPGPITRGFFESMGWTLCATLSVEDVTFNEVKVSPNPFSNSLNINFNNLSPTSLSIKLVDIKGALILQKENVYMNSNTLTIEDLDDLTPGIYFLSLSNKETGANLTKKIIKN